MLMFAYEKSVAWKYIRDVVLSKSSKGLVKRKGSGKGEEEEKQSNALQNEKV